MEYYEPFQWSGYTAEERIGEPETFDDALDRITMYFSEIEHLADRSIRYLTSLEPGRQSINSSTFPFRQKLDLLGWIISDLKDVIRFNTGRAQTDVFFLELKEMCLQANTLFRNVRRAKRQYRQSYEPVKVLDASSLATNLRSTVIEPLDPHQLLDISDFICYAEDQFEQFFLDTDVLCSKAT